MATDSVARAIALAAKAASSGGGGGLSTIVAGTGTSSIVMNHDDTNTNEASGNYSTALGYGTKAVGDGTLAAGYSETPGNVIAGEGAICCIGRATGTGGWEAAGKNSIAIGSKSDSSNKVYGADINSIAIGFNVSALGSSQNPAYAIGSNITSKEASCCFGENLSSQLGGIILGNDCHSISDLGSSVLIGTRCNDARQSWYSVAIGGNNGAANQYAVALGNDCTASGKSSIALGKRCKAQGTGSTALGYSTSSDEIISSGTNSVAIGTGTKATSTNSIAFGYNVNSGVENQTALGKYNIAQTSADETKYGLIFGNGTADARTNAFTLDWTGNATFAGTVTSASGADYAEYFEWKDGNVNSEDRVGYIVTLDGDKIVKAKAGDDILGIISGCATVIGDNAEWNWQGRFERDEFGRIIYDQVEQFIDTPDPDWEPNPEKPDEEAPMIKKSLGYFPVPRENAAYDPTKEYANRSNRPEWDTVGMMGKLYVRDDGTAAINDYVTVSATTDGVATKAEGRTSMRVMERVNDHIIRVCFK